MSVSEKIPPWTPKIDVARLPESSEGSWVRSWGPGVIENGLFGMVQKRPGPSCRPYQ